ncbi:MAG: DUF4190 domain-containing protein [Rhodanobacter sp.]
MSYQPPAYRATNALAVISMAFGISAWCILPFIGAIVAIICGHLARGEIRRAPAGSMEGDGFAIAGLVLGYVQLILTVLAGLILIAFVMLGISIGFGALHWH